MKLQSLMACGKIIPSTPVHKMHLATRAPQNILKHTDRFAERKYIVWTDEKINSAIWKLV
jgi:hypothetical protein